jgi:hypothetical protein
MVDQSKETPTKDIRGLASRFRTADQIWDMRTEEEKSMGLLVRRFEDGEPIRLQVSSLEREAVQVQPRQWGSRGEPSPMEVPLRLNLRQGDVKDYRWKTVVVPTTDAHQSFFLQFEMPFSSADGRPQSADVFVRPLDESDARRVVASGNTIDYRELLAPRAKELLKDREVIGVIGAQPVEIQVTKSGAGAIGK